MSFDRDRLPDPLDFYAARVVFREKRGIWRTTACPWHGGSDSLRINTKTGAFRCMACEARGGDIVAHLMAADGLSFEQAARALGAWADRPGAPPGHHTPRRLSAADALSLLRQEAMLLGILATDIAKGKQISEKDAARLRICCGRIQVVTESL